MAQRFKDVDWIGLFLWLFRAAIIVLVLWGTVAKIFFGAGNAYSASDWIDFFVSGLSQGSLYALIALGYTLVYGVLFMINFAHGEFFMSGTMTATVFIALPLSASGFLDRNPIIGMLIILVVAMSISVGVALLTERIAYRPLRRAPRLVPLITAIGASFFWQYFFRGLYGSSLIPFPELQALQGKFSFWGVDILKTRAVVIVSSVIMLIGLYFFVMRTKTGKAIRAVAEDKDVAALMGIDVDRTIAITFATGAAMAGAAGILYGLVFRQVHFFMGFVPGIKAFTAAVLGGIGSIPGAALGGLFLGVIEAVGPPLFLEGLGIPGGHQLKDVIAFTMLVLVLIFRPQGIIGERLAEKKA
ncbi:MAG: branched-chain amino acid ABC transporter permease [Ardenticatenaceae bacterium]|nr:branched-chain amino acid ABC transporter permease [Anaerolineales bacterium]MCB8921470.1 branched-chain amino acid ABC transporter permease [Ardenticatenaceae bacterium]MCB9004944.1 branched-chain amino acid ABC transporter permease [Ardenticatenaceae bacterium]